jgi:hypothetical protein
MSTASLPDQIKFIKEKSGFMYVFTTKSYSTATKVITAIFFFYLEVFSYSVSSFCLGRQNERIWSASWLCH